MKKLVTAAALAVSLLTSACLAASDNDSRFSIQKQGESLGRKGIAAIDQRSDYWGGMDRRFFDGDSYYVVNSRYTTWAMMKAVADEVKRRGTKRIVIQGECGEGCLYLLKLPQTCLSSTGNMYAHFYVPSTWDRASQSFDKAYANNLRIILPKPMLDYLEKHEHFTRRNLDQTYGLLSKFIRTCG